MQLIEGFNPLDHDPSQGGGSLPLGKYPVVIVGGEVKPTKDNTGGLIEFKLEVIDGPSKGATGSYRINLYNQSEDAKRIARSQLSAICHVTGVFQLGSDGKQLQALAGRPFVVNVVPQKGNEDKYTEVQGVFDMNGNPPAKAGAGASAAPAGGAQAWSGQQAGNGGGAAAGAPAAGAAAGWGGGAAAGTGAPAGGATGWNQSAAAGGAPASGKPSWGPQ